jgi:uncharacterized Zn-binding protein involved in type VI secretion
MITATGGIHATGKQVCVKGDIFDCRKVENNRVHGPTPVNTVKSRVTSKGKAILTTGDMAECGCVVIGTSGVRVGE